MTYIDLLAQLEVEDAHPGGFELTKKVISSLPISHKTKLLEVGCGMGKTALHIYRLYRNEITVMDMNDSMIQKAKNSFQAENVPIKIFKGNAENIPFPNNSFDMILSESVTSFTNVNKSISEYTRILKDSGIFIAIEMSVERVLHQYEEVEIKNVYGVKQIFTESKWIEVLKNDGFRSIQILGGSTIAQTNVSQIHPQKFQNLSNDLQNTFFEHQKIINKYKNILGYRILLCRK